MSYLYLFFIALLSGSLLPLGSEALFIYMIIQKYNLYLTLFWASLGNSLGGVVNYILGKKGEEFLERKNILDKNKIAKAKNIFNKYGVYALFLSPLPIIGDPITFIAGAMRYPFKKFFIILLLAKSIRYFILALLVL